MEEEDKKGESEINGLSCTKCEKEEGKLGTEFYI